MHIDARGWVTAMLSALIFKPARGTDKVAYSLSLTASEIVRCLQGEESIEHLVALSNFIILSRAFNGKCVAPCELIRDVVVMLCKERAFQQRDRDTGKEQKDV